MPYKDKTKRDGAKAKYRDANRDKLSLASRERYASNRELWYDYELQSNYDVTLLEYKLILDLQGGVCAICGGINRNGWRLCLDHNHVTNKARGILCRKCNSLLGLANDSVELLENAIGYLREHS